MMGGGGQYILDTLNAQQYRSRMHQVIKIIPTWQYWYILQGVPYLAPVKWFTLPCDMRWQLYCLCRVLS